MNYIFKVVSQLFFILVATTAVSEAVELSKISDKTIITKGLKKGTQISIFQIGPTGRSGMIAKCSAPCKKKVKLAEPFFISIATRRNKYDTYARRNSQDAANRDGTYWFDAKLKSSEEEAGNYFRLFAKDQNMRPERTACFDFTTEDLSERPKACFKNKPLLPAKTRRSGWCEVTFIVTVEGSTDNVQAGNCSEDMFRISSLEAARQFRYYPRLKEGVVVPSKVKSKVKFTLFNEKGKRVPARGE